MVAAGRPFLLFCIIEEKVGNLSFLLHVFESSLAVVGVSPRKESWLWADYCYLSHQMQFEIVQLRFKFTILVWTRLEGIWILDIHIKISSKNVSPTPMENRYIYCELIDNVFVKYIAVLNLFAVDLESIQN